ncbi:Hypothetical protein NTJ_11802 [Nesidiocoris tenuis]|uniref:Uncharacterized protein n=1 Tax=Nesidiocoris tenuis TaxID=355587 RepID=A0ABN7B774_9HEMI|nr:Hypothetical protein NTJ_11802 [Nesidiocoris tenuis]
MNVTGEKISPQAETLRKIPTDYKSEKGLLIIFGGPSLPREPAQKLFTASKLMVNPADHPSYYELNTSSFDEADGQ